MTRQEIKLVISDIDGTILNDQHQLSPELKEQVARLQERKIPLVLASARSPLGMEPLARELGLKQEPLAAYNGALIIKGDAENYQVLAEHPLDRKELQKMLTLLQEEFPDLAINLYSGLDWISSQLNRWVQLEAEITGESPQIKEDLLDGLDQLGAIHKMLLIDEPEVIEKVYSYLEEQDFKELACYLSKANYLEITARQVSKELALREIASYYQLPLEAVMAIGDNYNDLPMIRLAGLGLAMGNSPQAVKEAAQASTLSNNQNGVALALAKYITKKK
ncbi:Cof-type HAD-IIB family hydrolase [Streptococcus oricebi]|uniref:Cof-type HAD-IIB family hydrolase n=1 Tax=Streptococcus oricebi TaxID=1547447 RepID=A0ABS5B6Q5_9STRE|nr:Cof-type HAD-IIB family hydrolase [Streptococcus oricebi]MBP2624176.1 Cof-type HAD-IIB family hydrolase [Streptococcus oricebi]